MRPSFHRVLDAVQTTFFILGLNHLACLTSNGSPKVWKLSKDARGNISSALVNVQFLREDENPIDCMAHYDYPKSTVFVTGEASSDIVLWKFRGSALDKNFPSAIGHHGSTIKFLEFMSNGSLIVSASSTNIKIWSNRGICSEVILPHEITSLVVKDNVSDGSKSVSTLSCVLAEGQMLVYEVRRGMPLLVVGKVFPGDTCTRVYPFYRKDLLVVHYSDGRRMDLVDCRPDGPHCQISFRQPVASIVQHPINPLLFLVVDTNGSIWVYRAKERKWLILPCDSGGCGKVVGAAFSPNGKDLALRVDGKKGDIIIVSNIMSLI